MKMITTTIALAMLFPVVESMMQGGAVAQHSKRLSNQHEAQHAESRRRKPKNTSPVGKVFRMLDNLQAKIIKEEKETFILYNEETALCKKKHKALSWLFDEDSLLYRDEVIVIEEEEGFVERVFGEIDALTLRLAMKKQELAREIAKWEKYENETQTRLAEIKDVIGVIEQAIRYIEYANKNEPEEPGLPGSALLQVNRNRSLTLIDALNAMVKASTITIANASRVTGFAQTAADTAAAEDQKDDEDDQTKPAVDFYNSGSGEILDELNGLLEKAQKAYNDLLDEYNERKRQFEELVANIRREIENLEAEIERLKKEQGWHEYQEEKAKHDLYGISEDLKVVRDARELTDEQCIEKKNEFLEESALRKDELTALVAAENAIQAIKNSSSNILFLQTASHVNGRTDVGTAAMDFRVAQFMRDLGHKYESKALLQLAMRIASTIRHSASHRQDPFGKVKGLIVDMIAELEAEAAREADKFGKCHKLITEHEALQKEKEGELNEYEISLDAAEIELKKFTAMVAHLQKAAAEAAANEAQDRAIRAHMHELFQKNHADDTAGLAALRAGMKIITEYYQLHLDEDERQTRTTNEKNLKAAMNVINLMKVIEQDLMHNLAMLESDELKQVEAYEEVLQQYAKEREQNRKTLQSYEEKLSYALHRRDMTKRDINETLAALQNIHEILVAAREDCIATPAEEHLERIARLEAEKKGLERGLKILEEDTVEMAMLQTSTAHQRHSMHRWEIALLQKSTAQQRNPMRRSLRGASRK